MRLYPSGLAYDSYCSPPLALPQFLKVQTQNAICSLWICCPGGGDRGRGRPLKQAPFSSLCKCGMALLPSMVCPSSPSVALIAPFLDGAVGSLACSPSLVSSLSALAATLSDGVPCHFCKRTQEPGTASPGTSVTGSTMLDADVISTPPNGTSGAGSGLAHPLSSFVEQYCTNELNWNRMVWLEFTTRCSFGNTARDSP